MNQVQGLMIVFDFKLESCENGQSLPNIQVAIIINKDADGTDKAND